LPRGQKLSSRTARLAGGALVLFLPLAMTMHYLWRRYDWEETLALAAAQWLLLVLLVTFSAALVAGTFFGGPRARITRSTLSTPFESSTEADPTAGPALTEPIAPAAAWMEEPTLPDTPAPSSPRPGKIEPPRPAKKPSKPRREENPFDFS
jgi:hypothetical protein